MPPLRRFSAALLAIVTFLVSTSGAQTASSKLSGDQIIETVSPAVVLILAGGGDGKVAAIGSGLVIRSDGVVLTANHLIKGMKELQVRLKNGEVYDRVELIANDARRDIAAIRIAASGLTVLPMSNSSDLRPGMPVHVVSNVARACRGPLPLGCSAQLEWQTKFPEPAVGTGCCK